MESTTDVQLKIDENGWVIQIKGSFDVQEEEEEVKELCMSVFNVPKELLAVKPEAYTPQSISIGPYHHWRSELYEMERYKLAAARRFQKRINGLKFESAVVEEFKKHEWRIRSSYHKFLDYKEETLAWVMALDAIFLLECLQFYVRHADENTDADVKQLGRVLDPSGTSAAHNSIVRDLMMLENQLPLFLLQKLLELQLGSETKAEDRLCTLLRLVCEEFSPFTFKLPEDSKIHTIERGHILEVLYYAIVPISNNQNPNSPKDEEKEESVPEDKSAVKEAFSLLWNAVSSLNIGPVRFLTKLTRRALSGRAVQVVMKLPLRLLSTLGNLPILSALKGPFALLVNKDANKNDEEKEGKVEGDEASVKIIPPTRDELSIPSVADLYSAGLKFAPTDGDLNSVRFDVKTATLYIPKVKLDNNTEIILRNLVAFEASAAPGAMVFTRYTDFMNGMIDSEADVRLLRQSGIICNHLQSDGEVASLWNSLGKCVRLTKVGYLDNVIEDVNRYYNRKWNVAVGEFVNEHIFGSWQFLSLVAAVILLVFTCLQAFCSVYDCKKWVAQLQD